MSGDPDEGALRNDTPAGATVVGASGFGIVHDASHTIVARNDADWYRIDVSGTTENSLLTVVADAPLTAGYLLRARTYEATSTACGADADCGSGGLCDTGAHVCLAWTGVQRPSQPQEGDPPGEGVYGDTEYGGLAPNHIEMHLPVFYAGGPTSLWLLVDHLASTPLDLPGFDGTPYTLRIVHAAEPDPADKTAAESELVAAPRAATLSDFVARRRAVALDSTITDPNAGANGFATLRPGVVAPPGACTPIVIDAFDAGGTVAAGPVTVTLAASAGTPVGDCTNRLPIGSLTVTGGSATAALDVAAGTLAGDVTLVSSGAGLDTVTDRLSVAAAGTPMLGVSAAGRRALLGQPYAVTVSIPQARASTLAVTLSASTGLTLQQVDARTGGYCTCGVDCSSSCGVIPAGQTSVRVFAVGASTGAGTVTAQAPGYGSASWTFAVNARRTLTVSVPVSGYISYDGDQDWFVIDAGAFPKSSVRLAVSYPASPVDIRFQVRRGATATGFGRTDDTSGNGCGEGGSADTVRNTCNYSALTASIGPEDCTYLPSTDSSVYVWVNDVDFNDADTASAYQLSTIELVEGCDETSPLCTRSFCAQ